MGNNNSSIKVEQIEAHLLGKALPENVSKKLEQIDRDFVFFRSQEFLPIVKMVTQSTSNQQRLSALSQAITQFLAMKQFRSEVNSILTKYSNSSVSTTPNNLSDEDEVLIKGIEEAIRQRNQTISNLRIENEKISSLEKENKELRVESNIRKETELKLLEANTKITKLEQENTLFAQQLANEQQINNVLMSKIEELNAELKSYRTTRQLQNSGLVVNSETQIVVEKCSKLLTKINDKCFNCIMETELADHYIHYISNSIFETLLVREKVENLGNDSWELFLSRAEQDESIKKEMLPAKNMFQQVVELSIELFKQSKEISFPEIKLVWLGKNGAVYSPDFFKITETLHVKDHKMESGTVMRIPVFPALVVGESKTVDRFGLVFEVIYD